MRRFKTTSCSAVLDVGAELASALRGAGKLLPYIAAPLIVVLTTGCGRTEGQSRADYLDPELRARVEKLKADVEAGPTSAEAAPEHSKVLWKWSNAFALEGGVIPIDVPSNVRQVTLDALAERPVSDGVRRRLDLFVRELAFKEKEPDALGTLRFASDAPIQVDSFTTIEEIYTVGARALEPGATLLIGRQMMPDQGELQHEDAGADHYVSIRSSNAAARWKKLRVPFNGLHSTRLKDQPNLAFRLEEGEIGPGQTVTFTFGDKSGGSRGFRVQTWSTDLLLLPIYVDFAGDGLFLSQRWPGVTLIGEPAVVSARVTVPSIVAPNEPFQLSVRSEDRWSNRSSGKIPAYDVLLDSKPWRKLPAGAGAWQSIAGVEIAEPGIHRFTVVSADRKVIGTSNPVWVRDDPRRVYWGETHGHVGFGEGQGSPTHFFEFGRDDARLDFISVTEHDALTDDWEWRELGRLVRQFSADGRFVTFLGYEWSAQRPQGGHHNVIFRKPGRDRVPLQEYPLLPLLYQGLRAQNDLDDVLIIPHAHNAGDWTRNDPNLERLVEVSSLHGTFEWFGNLYLKSGFEVGFVGGSDDHRTNPGMPLALPRPFMTQRSGIGAVWATEKTTGAIFDALKDLSAYASTGERIILDASLNGYAMGTRQPDSKQRRVEAKVAGTSPIDHIDLVKNGNVVFSRDYLGKPLATTATLQVAFQSSSEVFFPPERDNPRPQRVWKGTLEVSGAKLAGVTTPGFDNIYSEFARRDEKNPNRVEFLTQTRGRMDTLLLELDGASARTAIRFHLEPTLETGSKAGNLRADVEMPEADFELRLDSLDGGRIEHPFQVGPHTDRIAIQVIDPAAPLDRSFEYTDLTAVAPGDYYYVRVTQLDGNQAFSSPFWVGAASRPPVTPSPIEDLLKEDEGKSKSVD
jgi:hypothetical protein